MRLVKTLLLKVHEWTKVIKEWAQNSQPLLVQAFQQVRTKLVGINLDKLKPECEGSSKGIFNGGSFKTHAWSRPGGNSRGDDNSWGEATCCGPAWSQSPLLPHLQCWPLWQRRRQVVNQSPPTSISMRMSTTGATSAPGWWCTRGKQLRQRSSWSALTLSKTSSQESTTVCV